MSHHPHFAQAIAEQRQAGLIAAAAQDRLARATARRRSTAPLQPRGRHAARLASRFRHHATT
jgi:hypothetical protein